jgi:DNA polymerase III delta prime subunit
MSKEDKDTKDDDKRSTNSSSSSSSSSSASSAAESSWIHVLEKPQSLIEIAGQDNVKRDLNIIFTKLNQAIDGSPTEKTKEKIYREKVWKELTKIPHVIFHGPPGVGKTSLAHIWIQELGRICHRLSPSSSSSSSEASYAHLLISRLPDEPTNKQLAYLKNTLQQVIPSKRLFFVLLDDFENVPPDYQEKVAYLIKASSQKQPWVKIVVTTNKLDNIHMSILRQCQLLGCLVLSDVAMIQHLSSWQKKTPEKSQQELKYISLLARGDVRQAHLLWYQGVDSDSIASFTLVQELATAVQNRDFKASMRLAQELHSTGTDWTLVYETWIRLLPHQPISDHHTAASNDLNIVVQNELRRWANRVRQGVNSFLQLTGMLARIFQSLKKSTL